MLQEQAARANRDTVSWVLENPKKKKKKDGQQKDEEKPPNLLILRDGAFGRNCQRSVGDEVDSHSIRLS